MIAECLYVIPREYELESEMFQFELSQTDKVFVELASVRITRMGGWRCT